ncbi:hypothetical protein ES15_1946 [Cronobacter sakazakii ES15]|nr:hypothetical protein ES15_1946 [Cronobacter sakazakii ES15]
MRPASPSGRRTAAAFTAFTASFCGTLAVIFKISAAILAAFTTGFRSAFTILSKIT